MMTMIQNDAEQIFEASQFVVPGHLVKHLAEICEHWDFPSMTDALHACIRAVSQNWCGDCLMDRETLSPLNKSKSDGSTITG